MTHDDLSEVVDSVGDMTSYGQDVWRRNSVSKSPVCVAECILFGNIRQKFDGEDWLESLKVENCKSTYGKFVLSLLASTIIGNQSLFLLQISLAIS